MSRILERLVIRGESADQIITEETAATIHADEDPNFIHHKEYTKMVQGVQFKGFTPKDGVMNFSVPSVGTPGTYYDVRVQLMNYDTFKDYFELNRTQRARKILNGDVRVFCPCLSFLYWGYQYINSRKQTSIRNEPRYPDVRNPKLLGSVCKHLSAVLRVLPFYASDLAKELPEKPSEKAIKNTGVAAGKSPKLPNG